MLTAIIQARLSSTRLPGKVLIDILGRPLIWHIVNRLNYCKAVKEIILATTENSADDILCEWAERNGIKVYRGSESDVLGRFYFASFEASFADILRITADDPLKDPEIIENVYNLYLRENLDFAYNNNPPTFPEGLDVEIFSKKALIKANFESADSFEREHVTQYFYRHPEKFKQKNYSNNIDLSHLRWTLDTEEDLVMIKLIYENLYKENKIFKLNDILNLIVKKPEICKINENVKRSAMYLKNDKK